ncbi:MAG: elongation factor P [Candidatus Omnitrophica bacterium]|nr:elongation factor P [Candidatus Omnitrophota bacterium]
MISTNEFKTGITVLIDNELYAIVEYQHVKPGKGGAFVRTKLRRVKDGNVIERTFRAGEKFQDAYIEDRKLQFLYRAGETFHFMDQTSFEDVQIQEKILGAPAGFLKENMEITGNFYDGELIGLQLPIFVELQVVETEPGVRGDTSKAGNKPAKLETGVTIQVPLFIESGGMVRIDTRNGSYVSRA